MSKLSDMREIKFTYRGANIHPREIFSKIYLSLDKLVKKNRASGGTKLCTEIYTSDADASSYYEEINLAGEGFSASASFSDGTELNLKVRGRTNFDSSLLNFARSQRCNA